MKIKILFTALFISLGLNAYLYLHPTGKGVVRLEGDSRIAIQTRPEYKEFVLREMRQFIKGINMINRGIVENDPEPIIKAGNLSGKSVHPPAGLVLSMPAGFLKMGKPTHKMFDEIADSARVNFKPETTQRQLVELTNRCVVCHSAYRLAAE